MIELKELGYLMIDQRAADAGVPEDMARAAGIPELTRGGLFEASTFTCTHCGCVVVLNPARTRARTKCHGCRHLICDNCAAIYSQTHTCLTLAQQIEQQFEQAVRAQGQAGESPSIILP